VTVLIDMRLNVAMVVALSNYVMCNIGGLKDMKGSKQQR